MALLLASTAEAQGTTSTPPSIPADAPANVRALLEECLAPSAATRGDAAKRLGELGPAAATALPTLLSMLGDQESYMDSIKIGTMVIHGTSTPGRQAALAAGSIGGPAIDRLLQILKDSSSAHRTMAALGLGASNDPRAVTPLIAALRDSNATLRAEAASALGSLSDQRAIPALISALSDADKRVVDNAHLGWQSLSEQRFGVNAAEWATWWKSQPGASAPAPQTPPASPASPRVVSARRTMEYQTVDMRTLRPRDDTNDVLLVVELAGLSVEEFQKLAPKDMHVRTGETRYETVMTGAGLVSGKTEIHILFNVPKTLLAMQLVVGSHPPVSFNASKTIEPIFKRGPEW